jgi:hypothetical protein
MKAYPLDDTPPMLVVFNTFMLSGRVSVLHRSIVLLVFC